MPEALLAMASQAEKQEMPYTPACLGATRTWRRTSAGSTASANGKSVLPPVPPFSDTLSTLCERMCSTRTGCKLSSHRILSLLCIDELWVAFFLPSSLFLRNIHCCARLDHLAGRPAD